MLNIIHQNKMQKIATPVYYYTPDEAPDVVNPGFLFYAFVEGYGMIPVAAYDNEQDAKDIFARMVGLEEKGLTAVMPDDNPEAIQEFLSSFTKLSSDPRF